MQNKNNNNRQKHYSTQTTANPKQEDDVQIHVPNMKIKKQSQTVVKVSYRTIKQTHSFVNMHISFLCITPS
jgi:hypothetical protein